MAEKKTYLIVQSVLCVLLCVLLAASAVSIYREGVAHRAEDPMASIYTREKTAEKFKPIAPLFFGAIGMTVAGWILAVKDENADKPVMDAEIVRNLTVSRVKTPSEAMLEEQKKQKQLALTGWGLFALCMVPIAIYMLNGKHFPDGNLEEMIAALAIHVFPWIILGLGSAAFPSRASCRRRASSARPRPPRNSSRRRKRLPTSRRRLRRMLLPAAGPRSKRRLPAHRKRPRQRPSLTASRRQQPLRPRTGPRRQRPGLTANRLQQPLRPKASPRRQRPSPAASRKREPHLRRKRTPNADCS